MPSQCLKLAAGLLLGCCSVPHLQAAVYPLPPPDVDVIGQVKVIYARSEDTLLDIARRHGLGYDEMVHANPGLDRWAPGEGTPVVLPTRYILPDTPREGLVLNIAELRLYYYPKAGADGERVVYTYPVSIGRMDWKTPLGLAKVTAKEVDPPWRPPASIKAEHAAQGDILPDVVPGGPDNPLGRHALRLSIPSYLIHGTNRPNGIGMRVTHGCVRMYPEDVAKVFGMVPVGTPLRIVDQPVKLGRINGYWLVEVHEPLEEDNIPIKVTLEQATRAVAAKTGPDLQGIDRAALEAAIDQLSGIPVSIAALPGSGAALVANTPAPAYVAAPPAPAAPMSMPATASLPPPSTAADRAPSPNPARDDYDSDVLLYDRQSGQYRAYRPVPPAMREVRPPAPSAPATAEPPPAFLPHPQRPYMPAPAGRL